MIKELETSILEGKYDKASKICESINKNEVNNIIWNIAYDTENINTYCFAQYMFKKTGIISWLHLSIFIMSDALVFIEGADIVAFFHTRELLLIERNIENLQSLLSFYIMPKKFFDDEEAKYVAKELLELDPNNELGLYVLSELEK